MSGTKSKQIIVATKQRGLSQVTVGMGSKFSFRSNTRKKRGMIETLPR